MSTLSEDDVKQIALTLATEHTALLKGKNGEDGLNGLPGKDGAQGRDGINGRDGPQGRDGDAISEQTILLLVSKLDILDRRLKRIEAAFEPPYYTQKDFS